MLQRLSFAVRCIKWQGNAPSITKHFKVKKQSGKLRADIGIFYEFAAVLLASETLI